MTKMDTSASRLAAASRLCLRCEQERPASAFNIATHVEDRCIAARELERREMLPGKRHPDLEGKEDGSGGKLRYLPSVKALRIVAGILVEEAEAVRGLTLRADLQEMRAA